jgi:hypothetical protein
VVLFVILTVSTVVPAVSASTWTLSLASASSAESQAKPPPAAPTGVSSACVLTLPEIRVSWTAVTGATSYAVYDSTTSSSSGFGLATSGITTTSWTSAALSTGNYYFEVVAYQGANWVSTNSNTTNELTITAGLLCT